MPEIVTAGGGGDGSPVSHHSRSLSWGATHDNDRGKSYLLEIKSPDRTSFVTMLTPPVVFSFYLLFTDIIADLDFGRFFLISNFERVYFNFCVSL